MVKVQELTDILKWEYKKPYEFTFKIYNDDELFETLYKYIEINSYICKFTMNGNVHNFKCCNIGNYVYWIVTDNTKCEDKIYRYRYHKNLRRQ